MHNSRAEITKVAQACLRFGNMTSLYHRTLTVTGAVNIVIKPSIVKSDLDQKGQVTFPKSHSIGRARTQAQRQEAPELQLGRGRGEEARVDASPAPPAL